MNTKTLLLGLAVAASLAACGGGSDSVAIDPPTATNEVPASATASATAYTQFAKSLSASDSSQPLDVRSVTPPTSETDAPVAL
jgi:hypothetical protein